MNGLSVTNAYTACPVSSSAVLITSSERPNQVDRRWPDTLLTSARKGALARRWGEHEEREVGSSHQ